MDSGHERRLVNSYDSALIHQHLSIAVDLLDVLASGGVHEALDRIVYGGDPRRLEVYHQYVGLCPRLQPTKVPPAKSPRTVEGCSVEDLGARGGVKQVSGSGSERL